MPNPDPGADAAWCAPGAARLGIASWDEEEYFVFNPETGDTHILNRIGLLLLRSLAEQSRSLRELQALVAAGGYSVPADAIAVHLERLCDLLLAEPVER